MNKRDNAIVTMRIAGYHNDSRLWTETYIENRVSRRVADKAWLDGQRQKANGARCNCRDCKQEAA